MKPQFIFTLFFSLVLSTSCAKKAKIEGIKLTLGKVESTVSTINSGTIEAQSQAELAFGTMGRINRLYVSLGAKVKEGDLIAELENADLRAIFDEASKELERARELYKNGLVSIANLDSAKRAAEVARLNYQKTRMSAPFSGMITAMDLKVGEYYQSNLSSTNRPLVQIIDLKKRLIKGEIDEIDLQKVSIGQRARVKIPALKNQIVEAVVTKVVPFVSTAKDQDRTSQIELEILDSKLLVPVGASADVEIITDTKDNVSILPTNVLFGTGKNRFLYKVDDGVLVKTEVKVGMNNYERAEILEGVTKDDLIARSVEGVELNEGLKVEVVLKPWP